MNALGRNWAPAMSRRVYDRKPPVGELIGHDGKPWRVLSVEDIPAHDWSDPARVEATPSWYGRPFRVMVESPEGDDCGSMVVEPWHRMTWHVLPEHYAICVSCGDLAPCRAHQAAEQSERAMVKLEREMRLLPGCCPSCQEPITARQKSKTFVGANLLNPLGEPDVTYHTRMTCIGGAARYEEMWVRADPTRPRSLLTMFCEGTVVVHHDGSGECFGAADSTCPDVRARHRLMRACFTQSHGCPRGCSIAGHPGTRVRADS